MGTRVASRLTVEELRARIGAALALHPNVDGQCYECDDDGGGSVPWPCPTVRALTGDHSKAGVLGYITIAGRKLMHVARVVGLGGGAAHIEPLCGGVHSREVAEQDGFALLEKVREMSTFQDDGGVASTAVAAAAFLGGARQCWRCRREARG